MTYYFFDEGNDIDGDVITQICRRYNPYTRIIDIGQSILTSEQKERLINTGKL